MDKIIWNGVVKIKSYVSGWCYFVLLIYVVLCRIFFVIIFLMLGFIIVFCLFVVVVIISDVDVRFLIIFIILVMKNNVLLIRVRCFRKFKVIEFIFLLCVIKWVVVRMMWIVSR